MKMFLVNEWTNMLNAACVRLLSLAIRKHNVNIRFHSDQSFVPFYADTHTSATNKTWTVVMFYYINSYGKLQLEVS